jgi:flagellin
MSGLVINHNLGSMSALSALNNTQNSLNTELEQLSTGKQINSAADNAAGYAISQKMQSQINGLNQASQNSQDGISLLQTANGALNETQSILQNMRQLAVQAANDTNTQSDRQSLQDQVNQLTSEIDNIAQTTQFNTKDLLDGSAGLQTTVNSETVSGNNANFLNIVGATSQTASAGTLDVTAATAASGATKSYTMAATAGPQSVTINGHTISYTADGTPADDEATLAQTINDNSQLLGVSASVSGGKLNITTADVGSAATLTVSAAAGALTGALVNDSVTGTDATITDATVGANYIATGNTITVTGGSFQGMQMQLNGSEMSSTGANNLANISITGNGSLTFQIGANQNQTMSVSIQNMSASALGVNNIDVTSAANASNAITTISSAIDTVTEQQAQLGAYQNRLQDTMSNLDTSTQNLTTAQSGITDTNMAQAMADYTKDNVLQQAAVSMLAQANQQPQLVLKLLG